MQTIYSSQDGLLNIPRAYYAYLGLYDFAYDSHQAWKESSPLFCSTKSYLCLSLSSQKIPYNFSPYSSFSYLVPTVYGTCFAS